MLDQNVKEVTSDKHTLLNPQLFGVFQCLLAHGFIALNFTEYWMSDCQRNDFK